MSERPRYKLFEGSLQDRFLNSTAKVQMFAGGFANGKTTGACIKALRIGKDYPGANILMARSTYPRLNDTLRKEFLKWCPANWIDSFTKSDNILQLTNGTVYNFRYVAQKGKSAESTTSNLLSATYDLVVIDQIEDPEIAEKDFDDLLGRMRGSARYEGDNPNMPDTGPRQMIITCNPTRNWVFRKLVKPVFDLRNGVINKDLLVELNEDQQPIYQNGYPKPMVEIFEGSTYENRDNLPADYLRTLEAAYTGQMRDRFLLGQWKAYEGLVYPQYDQTVHLREHQEMLDYFYKLQRDGYSVEILEGYDYGLAAPACYLFGFVDHRGNVFILDGFHKPETTVDWQQQQIKRIRRQYGAEAHGTTAGKVWADPSIFRRGPGGPKVVGATVAGMFQEYGIGMRRGNNNITNGVTKLQGYLVPLDYHRHPLDGTMGAPRIFFSKELSFIDEEFNDYYWDTNTQEQRIDKPRDINDHAMDTLRYLLSRRPPLARLLQRHANNNEPVYFRKWHEIETVDDPRRVRYG